LISVKQPSKNEVCRRDTRDRQPGDLLVIGVLLVLTALPDAMVVPILEELLVGRYDVDPGLSHAFISINLLGGLCALPLLRIAMRRGRPILAVAIAAVADAALLAAMWLPIGFGPTILLRAVEGAADVIVFAVVFDLIGQAGRRGGAGLRFGFGAALLSTALGGGAILGGQLADGDAGSGEAARAVYLVGASACLLAGIIAFVCRNRLRRLEGVAAECAKEKPEPPPIQIARAPLWPLMLMAGADRAAGGLLTGTLGLFLAEAVGLAPSLRGGLIGSVLLLMGLGAIPAGWVSDRFGDLFVRAVGGITFAMGLFILPLAASDLSSLSATMLLLGVGGATLLPTSLSLLDRLHGGLVGMGGFRAAGDIGFLVGVSVAGFLVHMLGDGGASQFGYASVIAGFAIMHLCCTAIVIPLLARYDRRSSRDSD
jgi:MFS family permease